MGWLRAGKTETGLKMWILDPLAYADETEPEEHKDQDPEPLDLEADFNWDLNSDD